MLRIDLYLVIICAVHLLISMSSFRSKLILWLSDYKGCCIVFFILFSSHRTKLVRHFFIISSCNSLSLYLFHVNRNQNILSNGFCVKSIERSRYRYRQYTPRMWPSRVPSSNQVFLWLTHLYAIRKWCTH